jgi:polar amino acid transport system substrate-binding protein
MNTKIRLLTLVALVGVAAGCSVEQPPATPTNAVAPAALPDGVQYSVTSANAAADPSCVRTSSYPILPDSASSPTLDTIRQHRKLVVGVSQTGFGLSYRDSVTGKMAGFEVDIVNHIATALFGTDQNTVEWVSMEPGDWPAALTGKQAKDHKVTEVDMALGAMTMTCSRWQEWDFSTQYLNARQLMLVRHSSPITSMRDIGGRRVCSSSGSTNLNELVGGHIFPKKPLVVSAGSNTDCMVLLQQNRVDAVFTADVILAELAAQDGTVDLLPADNTLKLPDEPVGIGIRQTADHSLTRVVNGVLARFRGDGQADRANTDWEKSYTQWLANLGPEQPPTPAYLSQ